MAIRYDVDDSMFPIVRTFLDDRMDLVELEKMIARYYDLVLERGEPYVSVVDAREVRTIPTSRMRRVIGDQRRRAADRGVDRLIRGIAVVTSNKLLHSTLAVVEWIAPLSTTWTVAATPDEAIAWARVRLEDPLGRDVVRRG